MPDAKKKIDASDDASKKVEPEGPTPAEAAAGGAANTDLTVHFRDVDFVVPRNRVDSLHFKLAIANMDYASMMTETLDPAQQFQLLQMVTRGEDPFEVANEYMTALSKAGGSGNSPSSG